MPPIDTSPEIVEITQKLVSTIVSIEEASFLKPWTESMISGSVKQDHVFAIRQNENYLGYIAYTTVLDSAELLRIAVLPSFQKKGFGSKLMNALIRDCSKKGVKQIFLEVRQSNLEAIELYKKFGFETLGVRERYYRTQNGYEDALTMCKEI